jgi:hypothetical protein
VQKAAEGIGLAAITAGIMVVFGVASLLVMFAFHSILDGLFAASQKSHIPFLLILAAPIWISFPVVAVMNFVRFLRRRKR